MAGRGEVIALAGLLTDKLSELRNTRFRAEQEIRQVEQELSIVLPQYGEAILSRQQPLPAAPEQLPPAGTGLAAPRRPRRPRVKGRSRG